MKKFVIEVLYPEYNNLYGDRGNAEYLAKKLNLAGYEMEMVETNLFDEPRFVNGRVDILLIGPCQEKHQLIEIEMLKKYRDAIENRIENGKMLEYTTYSGNYYGTPLKEVNEAMDSGYDVILEIEVDGAMQIKKKMEKETTLSAGTCRMISLALKILNQLWMESSQRQ